MEVSNLHVYDGASPGWVPFTRAMLSGAELTPIGGLTAITVGTSTATLAALMTAAGGASIAANCTWIEMRIRDGQAAAADQAVVKLNYTAGASSTLYNAVMSRATSSGAPDSLIGRATKALFDAYNLISTASTVVLVQQYTG